MYILKIISLLILKIVNVDSINLNPCEGKIFLNHYYDEQVLFTGVHKPVNLIMDRSADTLFFSHTVRKATYVDFNIRVCDIPKMKCRDLKEVVGGRAVAYDRINNEVYFGGRKGIYKYNYTSGTADFYAEKGKSIWNLFIQKYLYYIESNTMKLFVYENSKFNQVPEVKEIVIENFFVSKRLRMYYSNKTGLYRGQRPVKPVHLIGNIQVRQIVQDYATNSIFFAANDGIYYSNDDKEEQLKKAADIPQLFGITLRYDTDSEFEPGQLVYSNKNALYRLVPSRHSDQCLEIKSRKSLFYMSEKIRRPHLVRKIGIKDKIL